MLTADSPIVSVLMPVFNGEKYLKEAINSILEQTFSNFELIIINDGSIDSTAAIIDSFQDQRIKKVNNSGNLGLIASLNKGIGLCRGKYIARMDADDISLPERLEVQLNLVEKNKQLGVIGSGYSIVESTMVPQANIKLPETHNLINWALFFYNPIAHPTVLIRADLLSDDLQYDAKFIHTEDYELWNRLAENTLFYNIPETLCLLRKHEGNVSTKYAEMQLQSSIGISARKMEMYLGNAVNLNVAKALYLQKATSETETIQAANTLIELYNKFKCQPGLTQKERKEISNDVSYRLYQLTVDRLQHLSIWKFLLKAIQMDPLLLPRVLKYQIGLKVKGN